jgi:hypothetical protein
MTFCQAQSEHIKRILLNYKNIFFLLILSRFNINFLYGWALSYFRDRLTKINIAAFLSLPEGPFK